MKEVLAAIFHSLLKPLHYIAGFNDPAQNTGKVSKLKILIIIVLVSAVAAEAQNQSKIDSLGYLAETTRDDSARVYLNVAISKEYSMNDVITSLDYGEKALFIAESSGNLRLISYSLFNMGVNYYRQGLMEQSIRYFSRYLEINQELADRKGIAYAMTNIGAIYLDINEPDKASEYFKQALDGFEDLYAEAGKRGREVISIYNNLGIIARRHHQTDSAIYYYNRGINLARQTPGVRTELANLLNNLGNLYL